MRTMSRRQFLAAALASAATGSAPLLLKVRPASAVIAAQATTSIAVPTGTAAPQGASSATLEAPSAVLRTNYISTPAVIQQYSLDCEAAALQAALAARGTSVTQDWILAQIGADTRAAVRDASGAIAAWGDPYQTFVGDVRGSEVNGTGYGVYYGPIAAAAQAAGHDATGGVGWTAAAVYQAVSAGYPVVIWTDTTYTAVPTRAWTAWDGRKVPYAVGEHAVTLTGLDVEHQRVQLLDVETGQLRTFSMDRFTSFWSSFDNMAVVVR